MKQGIQMKAINEAILTLEFFSIVRNIRAF